jgi:hypothetical protein
MEKLLISELNLRKKLYYQSFLTKVLVTTLLIGFMYTKAGMYDIISMSTLLAASCCLFIQIVAVGFDFFIAKQVNEAAEIRKNDKDSLPEKNSLENKNSNNSSEKLPVVGNKVIHIFYTILICSSSIIITCFEGEIIDETDTGFIVFMIFLALIIFATSIFFFYHPNIETQEKIKQ